MASFNCRATPGSLRVRVSLRGASLRGAGREICSIWRVMESSRWWMSATSRVSWPGVPGRWSAAAAKIGGAESPRVELSQSFSDMPARRAAASALSRTDGSMPSTLHDTREFMLSSGSDSGACHLRLQPPRASPCEETIEFRAGRLPLPSTFSRYGK